MTDEPKIETNARWRRVMSDPNRGRSCPDAALALSPTMSCPECGSHHVECVEKPHHEHVCHDCGYSSLASWRAQGEGGAK